MKNRILALITAVLMLTLCAVPSAALAETQQAWVAMPNSDGSLNLRAWPGKNFESVGYVHHGSSIQVYVGETGLDSENEQWQHVKVDSTGKTGYIKTKYITYSKPAAGGSTGSASATTIYVGSSGGTLHVRSGPGTEFSSAGYVRHGASVSVLERGSTWSKIKVASTGTIGYIKTKYLSGSSSSGTVSSPETSSPSGSYDLAAVMTKTASGSVNLRSGAGTGYKTVARLSRGTKLAVTGKSGSWYKVRTQNGKTGYISQSYVAFGVGGHVTGNVNFRKGASTNYGVIRQLSKGTSVTVHSVSGKWAKVTYGGKTGYVSISYLSLD